MAWLGRFDDFSFDPHNPKSSVINPKDGRRISNSAGAANTGYTPICNITSNAHHVSVIGVIIAKDGPKSVFSKRGSGNERHLIAFTVRDSDVSFINVTCWGGEQYVKVIATELHIGDVVDIKGALVQAKSNNPADDRFKPWTPSSCQLTVGETQGTVTPYSGLDIDTYAYLIQLPTRPSNDYYTLEDIQTNGMSLQGEHINILAVVKKVWPTKEITTKTGKTTKKVDVVLCDETSNSFSLTLWDNFTTLTETWIPLQTVIFAADVRISFNEYRSAMTASTDSKTIFTVDPDIPEAQCVREHSKTQSTFLPYGNSLVASNNDGKDPPLETINNVVNVREARNLMESSSEPSYVLMYAFLSSFDIDGEDRMVFKEVCSGCRKFLQESSGYVCGNPNCNGGELSIDGIHDVEYSLSVGLSDHTGSLPRCYVPPNIVEDLLSTKAAEFRNMNIPQRTQIKWTFLFERVKAVLKLKGSSGDNPRNSIKLLSLQKADADEVIASINSSKQ